MPIVTLAMADQSRSPMNIKQATLSRHIIEVEKRLRMILFDRKSQPKPLTLCLLANLYARWLTKMVLVTALLRAAGPSDATLLLAP